MESVDGSTSSQDDLEMKPTRSRTQGADVTGAHRLHPSRTRRKSDASANQYTTSAAAKSQYAGQNRDPRPPPSMRTFGSIPAIASLPPVNIGGPLSAFPTPGESGQSVLNQGSSAAPIAANKDNADVPQPPQVRDSTPPQPQLKVNDQPANVFPEVVGSESADLKSGKGKRVLKANGGKSPKKHRWAFSKTPAAVAV